MPNNEPLASRLADAANAIDLVAASTAAINCHGNMGTAAAEGAANVLKLTLASLDDCDGVAADQSVLAFIAEALPALAEDGLSLASALGIHDQLRNVAQQLRGRYSTYYA